MAIRFGFNPNSSSLGIDISFLLMGLAGVSLIAAAAGAFLERAGEPPEGEGS